MSTDLIDVTAIRTNYDCRAVAARYVTLDGQIAGHRELHGPCPKCGGVDRFFVSPGLWGCRVCGTGGDVVKLIQLAEGLEFLEAVEFLRKGTVTQRTRVQPTKIPERSFSESDEEKRRRFLAHAPAILDAAQRRLLADETPGGEYLLRRGLNLEVWHRFGLGYTDDAVGRGPGVAMPWYKAGNLTGIRYRLLTPPDPKNKIVSEPASQTSGVLFGGQAMTVWGAPKGPTSAPDPLARRTLVLVEGEINAMSIWQEMGGAPVDVLSMGGQSSIVSPAAIAYAQRYGACIVWMDEEKRARDLAKSVGGLAYWSAVDGQKADANDHLCAGRLHEIMAHLWSAATKKEHAAALAAEMAGWMDGMWLDLKAAWLEAARA